MAKSKAKARNPETMSAPELIEYYAQQVVALRAQTAPLNDQLKDAEDNLKAEYFKQGLPSGTVIAGVLLTERTLPPTLTGLTGKSMETATQLLLTRAPGYGQTKPNVSAMNIAYESDPALRQHLHELGLSISAGKSVSLKVVGEPAN